MLSDEVYEHIVFPPAKHHSVLSVPALRERSMAVFSFGKSLHATGLRVGYCVAPPQLTAELRKVHQFNTFSISTAFQHAIATYLAASAHGVRWAGRRSSRASRRLLAEGLAGSAFRVMPAQGTYFTLVDYATVRAARGTRTTRLRRRLLEEGGVASIPLTPFYRQPVSHRLLRLCIAKEDKTLAPRSGAAARIQLVCGQYERTDTDHPHAPGPHGR